MPTGGETSPFFALVWWSTAIGTVVAAWLMVFMRDLLKAAVAMVVVFLAVAGFLVMLNAEFLAVVQVLIYVGAVSILVVFAVLLTRDIVQANAPHRYQGWVFLLSGLVLVLLVFVVLATPWHLLSNVPLPSETQDALVEVAVNPTPSLGRLLVREFVLPFEAVSVVLLAALIGALVIARER
ncbi:MAG: NADH-quinone oxidoreductase subunit J [Dehalococcoidia bacterium]|nr:NADH-quinone oxidoreductase subunit J [Dehalococcoidia bacterium]MDW8119234.1 NADH-quinone oxidoreductase subunit J [Chloroflexota bacterium]